jgi:hypothetical protein
MAGTPLTRDEVIKAVSEVDDVVVAGLVGTSVEPPRIGWPTDGHVCRTATRQSEKKDA